MIKIFRIMKEYFLLFFYGSTKNLRKYEKIIITEFIKILDGDKKEILLEQIRNGRLQRLNKDRMNVFFFSDKCLLKKICEGSGENIAVSFSITAKKEKIRVDIVTYNGIISSLEFSKSPRLLIDSDFDISLAPKSKSYISLPEALDRFEHGSEGGR